MSNLYHVFFCAGDEPGRPVSCVLRPDPLPFLPLSAVNFGHIRRELLSSASLWPVHTLTWLWIPARAGSSIKSCLRCRSHFLGQLPQGHQNLSATRKMKYENGRADRQSDLLRLRYASFCLICHDFFEDSSASN